MPKGPPIDGEVVPLVRDDLGREVLGRAAERPRAVLDKLGEAEVDDLQVASKQHVGIGRAGVDGCAVVACIVGRAAARSP